MRPVAAAAWVPEAPRSPGVPGVPGFPGCGGRAVAAARRAGGGGGAAGTVAMWHCAGQDRRVVTSRRLRGCFRVADGAAGVPGGAAGTDAAAVTRKGPQPPPLKIV